MTSRLPPAAWFPAGNPAIAARYVTLQDGLSLRVLEAGPPGGQPVVMIHGWAVSAYLWRHNIAPLAASGFRVYVPDLPGHGLSGAPTERGAFTLARSTDRLSMLLDAIGVARAPLVAQSMGARIALELARRHAERVDQLVLFGPVGFGEVPPQRAFVPLLPSLPGALPSLLIPRRLVEVMKRRVHGRLNDGGFTDRDVDEYWAPSQFPDIVRAQLQMLREFDWKMLDPAVLASFSTKTTVVFGTHDRTVRTAHAARLASSMPGGRIEWVQGGGHVVMEEVPEQVNSLLLRLLGA